MNQLQKTYFFSFFIFLCFYLSGFAQQVKRLDTKEGLINGTINVFEKDSLGYLWIGSDKGLNRYSGVEFKNYDLKPITSMDGAGIIDILNFKDTLYMISPNGYLIKYNYEYDRFVKVLQIEKKRFLSLIKLDENRILISLDKGFLIFNTKSQKSINIIHPETFINRKVLVDGNTVYSASGKGCNIYEFIKERDSLILKETILEREDIINIALDSKKRLWIGTEVGGLFIKDKNEIKKVLINELQKKTYAIRKIKFDNQNNALVAIDRLGLFVIDDNLNIIKIFSHNIDDYNSISQNSIYEVYVDNSNAYWLGLREGGINIIYENDNIFKHISHVLNDENSINNNTVRSIYETEQGDLWFGSENGVSQLKNQEFINYYKNQNFLIPLYWRLPNIKMLFCLVLMVKDC